MIVNSVNTSLNFTTSKHCTGTAVLKLHWSLFLLMLTVMISYFSVFVGFTLKEKKLNQGNSALTTVYSKSPVTLQKLYNMK